MAEPYSIYDAVNDRASVSRPAFPGYLSSEPSELTSTHYVPGPDEFPGDSSDFLKKEYGQLRPSMLNRHDVSGARVRPDSVPGAIIPGAIGMEAYHPSHVQEPVLPSQSGDALVRGSSAIPDVISDQPSSLRSADGHLASQGDSNILFVVRILDSFSLEDLFRPFIGYKDIKVVHKEPRNTGDRATVLCFVEFVDAKCAATAMEALQGYKFDDKKPESPALKLHFAHFPFHLPSDRDVPRSGISR
ncbi:hypothetical protein Tsubulata_037501 [Turnera subulata]|uniref:RRM domain-containing protein n=1 Tax=Turnera subulata TaxID=218843 RepID=A0A9Q0F2M1_9ROSI|nr:hypothetical protein Tsubulata_037501 [Turnera subulata]